MTPEQVREQIQSSLPDATVEVRSDDNVHFEALVVAAEFAGLRMLQRHQLIYRALGAAVGREIHALTLDTLAPDEWARRAAG